MLFFFEELDLSEGRTTGIPTIQDKLRKNGSLPARIETDDARSYFPIEISNWEGFKNTIEPIEKESELKSKLKTLRIILDLMIENPEITTMALVERMANLEVQFKRVLGY